MRYHQPRHWLDIVANEVRVGKEPEIAIALRYDRDQDEVPRLAAKGRGPIAAQIVAIAKSHGITVRRDANLVAMLESLQIDAPIPLAAFAAVAEILAHLYRINDRLRKDAEK